MRKILLALSLTVTYSGVFVNCGMSQSQYNYPLPNIQAPKNAKFKKEFRQATGKEVIIPDIPKYPGSTFISGQESKKKETGSVDYLVTYSISKSSQSQVIPFYANLFNGGGWHISQQTEAAISASNESKQATCSVFVSSDGDTFSSLKVGYSVLPLGSGQP